MNSFLIHLKKLDWLLIISALLLVGVGLLSIYSSSMGHGNFLNFQKQIIFLGIGFFLMIAASFFDWRMLRNDSYLILILYFFCLLALAGLFFFAPEIRGVRGWYRLGPISIDPIQFTKIILIILLAKYFSTRHIEMYRMRHIILSGFYVSLPAALIFFQPDFGSMLILIGLWVGILIISGINLRNFLILAFCGILFFGLAWQFLLKDYQKERVVAFVAPYTVDPLGAGWQQAQAIIAIGSGGLFGKGIFQGSQAQYGFLPEPQTDFIFAAITEETGLIGASFLLLLFFILIYRIIKISIDSQTNFSRLFGSGLALILISQIFIHISMNLGIMPVIGISLPLVSYGGSGLIITFIGLGLLQSIKTH